MKPFILSLALIWTALFARAEDWTTKEGKTYQNVTVVRVEDDAVTILDNAGGARVPLQNLDLTLQKRFHYDPIKAEAAAKKFTEDDQASQAAVQAGRKAPAPASIQPVYFSAAPMAKTASLPPLSVEQKASMEAQISTLQSEIADLQQRANSDEAQSRAAFNSRENTYGAGGEIEHRYTESHSSDEGETRNKIVELQNQVAALQSKLSGGLTTPFVPMGGTFNDSAHHSMDSTDPLHSP